jgi:hypothetical protein
MRRPARLDSGQFGLAIAAKGTWSGRINQAPRKLGLCFGRIGRVPGAFGNGVRSRPFLPIPTLVPKQRLERPAKGDNQTDFHVFYE